MNTIFTIARLTFREAIRRRIVVAALIMGAAFLVVYGLGFHFIRLEIIREEMAEGNIGTAVVEQVSGFLVLAGLYVINFLSIATAALISADSLAGEIQSGTIQAIVTKPIRRFEVVLGKMLGHAGLLLVYLSYLSGGMLLIVFAISKWVPTNWLAGTAMIYFNGLIILSITLAMSSMLSTLATGGAVFGAYGLAFIGGWVERIGSILSNQTAVEIGIVTSLLVPSEAVWNKAASLMSPTVFSRIGMTPFSSGSEPSTLMMVYAALYLLAMLALAVSQFGRRDL